MKPWAHRVRPQSPPMPPAVQEVQNAAQQLAQQAHHAPGRVGTVFRTVADCALIGTAVISGALASVHLYKSLFPRPRADRHQHEPQPQGSGEDRRPPRHLTMVADHGRGRD
jgi:hypothetical protein